MVQPRTVNLDVATGNIVGKQEISGFPLWLAIDIGESIKELAIKKLFRLAILAK